MLRKKTFSAVVIRSIRLPAWSRVPGCRRHTPNAHGLGDCVTRKLLSVGEKWRVTTDQPRVLHCCNTACWDQALAICIEKGLFVQPCDQVRWLHGDGGQRRCARSARAASISASISAAVSRGWREASLPSGREQLIDLGALAQRPPRSNLRDPRALIAGGRPAAILLSWARSSDVERIVTVVSGRELPESMGADCAWGARALPAAGPRRCRSASRWR